MWKFFLILTLSLAFASCTTTNPCDGIKEGQQWVQNPRGCDMYFYCDKDGIAKPGRCQSGFHFYEPTQSCELPETVLCTIDDDLWNQKCPDQGITKVPHLYSCSEYSGEC